MKHPRRLAFSAVIVAVTYLALVASAGGSAAAPEARAVEPVAPAAASAANVSVGVIALVKASTETTGR